MKGDLSNFESGIVVGARRSGPSISETVDLLRLTISRVHREPSGKDKISNEKVLSMKEVRENGQTYRKATIDQLLVTTKVYRRASLNSNRSRRPHCVRALSAKKRILRLQFTRMCQNWIMQD